MPPKSSITRLPKALKKKLDQMLVEGRFTLDEIMGQLNQLEAGVSRSAVGRYAQQKAKARDALRQLAETKAAMFRELGDTANTPTGRVVVEIMQTHLFDSLMEQASRSADGGPAYSPKEALAMARAVRDSTTAESVSVNTELTVRKDQESRTKAAAVKAAETVAKEKGLSTDTIEAIKAQILGVKTT